MGLMYSVWGYLKSWYPYTTPIVLNETKIVLSSMKLIHSLRSKQTSLRKQAWDLQQQLLKTIKDDKKVRSRQGEIQLINTIVRKSQLLAAYQQIIDCVNIIKAQAKQLELDPSKISNRCQIAICTLIYGYKDLQLSDCVDLSVFVPEPHPQIPISQLSPKLQLYINSKSPTQFSTNTYILEMCGRNEITLEKVNEAGHCFLYTPSKYCQGAPNTLSRTSQMFAISLEQLQIHNQNDNDMFAAESINNDQHNEQNINQQYQQNQQKQIIQVSYQ